MSFFVWPWSARRRAQRQLAALWCWADGDKGVKIEGLHSHAVIAHGYFRAHDWIGVESVYLEAQRYLEKLPRSFPLSAPKPRKLPLPKDPPQTSLSTFEHNSTNAVTSPKAMMFVLKRASRNNQRVRVGFFSQTIECVPVCIPGDGGIQITINGWKCGFDKFFTEKRRILSVEEIDPESQEDMIEQLQEAAFKRRRVRVWYVDGSSREGVPYWIEEFLQSYPILEETTFLAVEPL